MLGMISSSLQMFNHHPSHVSSFTTGSGNLCHKTSALEHPEICSKLQGTSTKFYRKTQVIIAVYNDCETSFLLEREEREQNQNKELDEVHRRGLMTLMYRNTKTTRTPQNLFSSQSSSQQETMIPLSTSHIILPIQSPPPAYSYVK